MSPSVPRPVLVTPAEGKPEDHSTDKNLGSFNFTGNITIVPVIRRNPELRFRFSSVTSRGPSTTRQNDYYFLRLPLVSPFGPTRHISLLNVPFAPTLILIYNLSPL